AGRIQPGLRPQHLAAVEAAARISGGHVEGAELGSTELTFMPGEIIPGQYDFTLPTGGSATLMFQTVLPALLMAPRSSRLTFTGATHEPFAPPYEFIERCLTPLVNRMGPRVKIDLEAFGFNPPGGGRLQVDI